MRKYSAFFDRLSNAQRVAAAIVIVVLLWVLSSFIISPSRSDGGQNESASATDLAALLKIEHMQSQEKQKQVIIYGVTEPNRIVELKAETQGAVVEVPAIEGQRVKKGDVIVRIDERDRQARLSQARAILNQRQIEYKAAQRLQKSGYQTEVRLAETLANLKSARAELAAVRLDIKQTKLQAPFEGILETINVELGDFVGVGVFGGEGALAKLVDNDPLVIAGQISENDRSYITVGSDATIRLATGEEMKGTVRYLANVSEGESRTFRVEVEIINEDSAVVAGVTAELFLPAGVEQAYFITPSVLSLDDKGEIGLKAVDGNGVVQFYPATLLEDTKDGVWLTGLPSEMHIITLGHAFVSAGQVIEADILAKLMSNEQAPEALPAVEEEKETTELES